MFCFNKDFIIAILGFILICTMFILSKRENNKDYDKNTSETQFNSFLSPLYTRTNYLYNNLTDNFHDYIMHSHSKVYNNDTYKDPYTPPLKPLWNEPTNIPHTHPHVPINISTNYRDTSYRQVGILKRDANEGHRERETILALFGRPLHTSRSKWQYYTMTDKSNGIKLPIKIKKQGKICRNNDVSALSSYGCDELSSNDRVEVDGYNATFVATIFDSDVLEYI